MSEVTLKQAQAGRRGTLRQLGRYLWGTVARPRATFDALAGEDSIRWAVLAACLPVLQVWGNMLLHAAFGLDWLGTRADLADPTFIAGWGRLRVGLGPWVPVFAALMLLVALLGLTFVPGMAHLLGKLWGGQGRFEQAVNTITFATVVPNMVIGAASEWLFGVPVNLLSGHPAWWTAAMQGEFGPTVAVVWNVYVLGFYIGAQWVWAMALMALAVRRVQRIPGWAAALIAVLAFATWHFVASIFVR